MKYFVAIFALFVLSSCVKDKPQEPVKTAVSINPDNKVLIVNEGNYGWGHGTVSLYDPISGAVVEDYYLQQNNSELGNVCQSITKYNNNYYIVVNNSNKVIVVGTDDFIKKATITGFNSPRYLLPITYNKAYVSDLFQNSIQIVDLNTNNISGSIACKYSTEEMALIYGKVFVTCSNSNYCYVVNTATDAIIDSINVGVGASSLVIDKNAKVWVLSGGSSGNNQNGKLSRINPLTLQIETSYSFSLSDSPHALRINKTHDTLYYLNKGVCQLPISNTQLPSGILINQGSKVFYGLGVSPKDYRIYVSDAIDYIQKSKIEIYDVNGNFKNSFNAGIISNGFVFE